MNKWDFDITVDFISLTSSEIKMLFGLLNAYVFLNMFENLTMSIQLFNLHTKPVNEQPFKFQSIMKTLRHKHNYLNETTLNSGIFN